MPFKPRELEKLLLHKFKFEISPNHADDHRWFELNIDGVHKITTRLSHNNKEIGLGLRKIMADELHVRNKYFDEMFNCTKSKEQYEELLRTNPSPPFE